MLRAEKRAPELRQTDTTWSKGCTPAQAGGCIYGSWYLVEPKHEKVLRGPEETEKNLYADYKVPAGAQVKAVRVNPGTVLVRARPVESEKGKVTQKSPNSWFVMKDNPVLTGADVKNPRQSFDEGGGGTGAPNVTFEFTGHGQSVFQQVTKEIAERGQAAQLPGVGKEAAQQHFAVVLDGQLITTPSIDYTKYPEGIDANTGSQISGGFTISSAQELAQELQSGALPIKLELISNSQVSATLGKTALNQGLIAMLAGFAVVCLFLLLFYRVLGAIAVGGLVIYSIYFFALIKLIPITLTLPGIAGLILTIGVAADANIVIFERVKEEIRGGKIDHLGHRHGLQTRLCGDRGRQRGHVHDRLHPVRSGDRRSQGLRVHTGHRYARLAVHGRARDAGGARRDGTLQLVSHPAALGAARRGRGWTFDFMGASRWFFSLSGTILAVGALAIGGSGLNFGIDFKSGTRIQTAFVKPVSENQVATAMATAGYGNAQVQKFVNKSIGGTGYQISTKTLKPGVRIESPAKSSKRSSASETSPRPRSVRHSAKRWPTARSSRSSPPCW